MKYTLRSFLLIAMLLSGFGWQGRAQFIVGITETDQLFVVSAAAPGILLGPIVPISGLATGQTIVGADYRPRTGELYIMGYNSSTSEARLYVVNQTTAGALPVGTGPITLPLGTGSIGFDFNPTVDLIRVVAANRANYRLNPTTGAIVAMDGQLTYATGDPHAAATPSIGAAAYTNSYVGAEATTLYDYDETLNVLSVQNPPNNGTLNTVPGGPSGITVNPINRTTDLDIAFDSATGINRAYFVANPGISLNDNLYTINLSTGVATPVGPIGTGLAVKDIAVLINRTLPTTITGQLVYGLTRTNRNLITFDSDRPGTIRKFSPITGLQGTQRLVGMDFRPADRRLFALGYNDTTQTYQLYTIDTATAVATAVNAAAGTIALGTGNPRIGFDFNPTVDRIRVTSSTGANYRLNPADGLIAATDGILAYRSGDANFGRPVRIGSVAYTRSFVGGGTTTLYALDDSLGALAIIDTPNAGVTRTFLGGAFVPNNADPTSDIDIYYDSTSMTDRAFLSLNTGSGVNDSLWTFLPGTTAVPLTLVGRIGFGIPVMDIAVQLRFTGTTSVRDLAAVPGVKVYPNPAGETLFVTTEGSGAVRAVILDLSGRAVLTVEGNGGTTMQIAVGSLPVGLYSLRLEAGGTILGTAKVVKQ